MRQKEKGKKYKKYKKLTIKISRNGATKNYKWEHTLLKFKKKKDS